MKNVYDALKSRRTHFDEVCSLFRTKRRLFQCHKVLGEQTKNLGHSLFTAKNVLLSNKTQILPAGTPITNFWLHKSFKIVGLQ